MAQGKWWTLGEYIGGASYMGRCPCGVQHMSTHDRVYVVGGQRLCARCGTAVAHPCPTVKGPRRGGHGAHQKHAFGQPQHPRC